VRSHLKPLLLAALVAAAAPAPAQPSLLDQLFERHVRVKSAASDGVLHLLYERKTDPQAPPSSCYRRLVSGQGWRAEERLCGGHRCVAFLHDSLYVFRGDNYSIYRAPNWRAEAIFPATGAGGGHRSAWQSCVWPLAWPPEAACPVGGDLWIFGVEVLEGKGQMRAARLTPTPPGRRPASPTVLGKPLALGVAPSDVAALAGEATATVFWHQPAPGGQGNEVWHAAFDGDAWGTPRSVPVPYPNSDYAVAGHEGDVWVICKARGQRLKAEQPLLALRAAGDQWGAPAPIPGATDRRWLDWTLDIDIISFGGSLFVFRACMDRLVAHQWTEGHWREPETLLQLSPWPTYLFWWLMGNVALSFVLLPVVGWAAFWVRARPQGTLRLAGADVRVAAWTRRVAAQLVDFLVALLLCSAALGWVGQGDGSLDADTSGLITTLSICSGIYLTYFVVSEGLSGQSFGKLLLGIRVMGADGRRVALGRVLLRNLLRPWPLLVPAAYLVGSLFILLTRANRRLGDLLAGTVVVEAPPPAPSQRREAD